MTGIETTLARVLAEHDEPPGWTGNDVDSPVYECNCGDQSPALARDYIAPEDVDAAAEWHRAHVAAELVAALWADETLVQQVAEAIGRGLLAAAPRRASAWDLARVAVDAILGEDQ